MKLAIDFGTTWSQPATMYQGQPVLLLKPGEYGIPSDVYYDHTSGILVGQNALDAGIGIASRNLVRDVKMELCSGKTFTLDRRVFTGEELVKQIYKAVILRAVQMAERLCLDPVIESIVLTVPAKFGIQERCLLARACRECMDEYALPVKAIIREPVAAAMYYFHTSLPDHGSVLVYDLGGGTCDIALVKEDSSREHFSVVDSDMVRIGGRDWDKVLQKYISERICEKSGISCENPACQEKIRRAAESVKFALSDPSREKAMARVEINGRIHVIPVLRSAFDELTMPLLNQTLDCLEDVYCRNSVSKGIHRIICVGGGSSMCQVEEAMLRRFPECEIRLFEPEHAVVYGAAMYADMLRNDVLSDIAPLSYGIEAHTHIGHADDQNIIANVIRRGTPLPAEYHIPFRYVDDGSGKVSFRVFESDSDAQQFSCDDPEKHEIGSVELAMAGSTQKEEGDCILKLNTSGILEVKARVDSGEAAKAVFSINEL